MKKIKFLKKLDYAKINKDYNYKCWPINKIFYLINIRYNIFY